MRCAAPAAGSQGTGCLCRYCEENCYYVGCRFCGVEWVTVSCLGMELLASLFPDCLSDSPDGIPALVLPRPGREAGAGTVGLFALSALPARVAGAFAIYQPCVSFLALIGMYRSSPSVTSPLETQQTHIRSVLASDCHFFVLCPLHLQTSWALFYS